MAQPHRGLKEFYIEDEQEILEAKNRDCGYRLVVASFDGICGLFCNSIYGGGDVAANLERNDQSVDHTDFVCTISQQIGVDHASQVIGHHGGCGGVVVVGAIYSMSQRDSKI